MEHPPAENAAGDPKASGTLVAAAVGAVVVVIIVIALQALYYGAQEGERGRKVIAAVPEELVLLQATQLEKLTGYRKIDAAHGVVTVPIEHAMELTVRDQGRLPAASTPPAAAPAPAPAPASVVPAKGK
jgi:hypothetical protein